MIKIHLANEVGDQLGGGWTFLRNFKYALQGKAEFVDKESAQIYFITSSSMVSHDDVEQAKKRGQKVVLRVDNITRDSRNRNTGTSRMKAFAQKADAVIYQSEWAKEFVGYFLERDGEVIHNGVDSRFFNTEGRKETDGKNYLFVHYNRDENKRFPEAAMDYHYAWRKDKQSRLLLVGRYSDELRSANFDFFMGEPVQYLGVVSEPLVMGTIMRGADYLLYPSYSDACPNIVIEALACGVKILHAGHSSLPEIMKAYEEEGIEHFSLETMANKYLLVLNSTL